jgi:hypothetical protein
MFTVLGVFWLALVAVGVFVKAQGRQNESRIISGNDIGFRVDDAQPAGNRLSGSLVVRVNGQWVEAHFNAKAVPVPASR